MLNHIGMGKLAGWRLKGHHERVRESYMMIFALYKNGDRDLPFRLSAGRKFRPEERLVWLFNGRVVYANYIKRLTDDGTLGTNPPRGFAATAFKDQLNNYG